MRDTPWNGFCERHAYERRAYEMAAYEMAAYERHAMREARI
jgi:hypothetical protein